MNGQVANIAARIVGEAKDGVILVGPETARRIHGRINSALAGFRRLKGLTMEVELFLVA